MPQVTESWVWVGMGGNEATIMVVQYLEVTDKLGGACSVTQGDKRHTVNS